MDSVFYQAGYPPQTALMEARRLHELHRRTGAFPYRFGGNVTYGPRGEITGGTFDCSAFTQHCYGVAKVKLPRTSAKQAKALGSAGKWRLRPGDILAFDTDGDGVVNHVAIYSGNDRMIHTSPGGKGISEENLTKWWRKALVAVRRY